MRILKDPQSGKSEAPPLATFASLRWGEATALRRCDIAVSIGAITVRAAFVERSTGELVLSAPKSRAGRRVVGIP
ncbi:MAG TPA: hypothetical protein VFD98_16160, partial [Terracidiphilus sp.]|nr:hypothetical protein [Terracidiphilus sp.]